MIDGLCRARPIETANVVEKAMRVVFTLSGNVPREV